MDQVSFDDFKKLEIRIGKILSAEKIESSNKLLKLQVDFGIIASDPLSGSSQSLTNADSPVQIFTQGKNLDGQTQTDADTTTQQREIRQILAGIAKFYAPELLVGKLCPFVFNLAPKIMGELESQGMILCADNGEPVLLHPDKEIPPGSTVK